MTLGQVDGFSQAASTGSTQNLTSAQRAEFSGALDVLKNENFATHTEGFGDLPDTIQTSLQHLNGFNSPGSTSTPFDTNTELNFESTDQFNQIFADLETEVIASGSSIKSDVAQIMADLNGANPDLDAIGKELDNAISLFNTVMGKDGDEQHILTLLDCYHEGDTAMLTGEQANVDSMDGYVGGVRQQLVDAQEAFLKAKNSQSETQS